METMVFFEYSLIEEGFIFPVMSTCSSIVWLFVTARCQSHPVWAVVEAGEVSMYCPCLLSCIHLERSMFVSPLSPMSHFMGKVSESASSQNPEGCGQCLGCLAHSSSPFTTHIKTVPEGGIRAICSLLGYSYGSFQILSFFNFQLFFHYVNAPLHGCMFRSQLWYHWLCALHITLTPLKLQRISVLWMEECVAGLKRCSWKTQWYRCTGKTHVHPSKLHSFVPTVL